MSILNVGNFETLPPKSISKLKLMTKVSTVVSGTCLVSRTCRALLPRTKRKTKKVYFQMGKMQTWDSTNQDVLLINKYREIFTH